MRPSLVPAALAAALVLGGPAALAQSGGDPVGVWTTQDGSARVQVARCGPALCGSIVGAKAPAQNGRSLAGARVLADMAPEGAGKWRGQVFDPETGSSYGGTIEIVAGDRLKVTGCALGGLACQSESWTRSRP